MMLLWFLLATLHVIPDPVDLAVGDTVEIRVLQDGRPVPPDVWDARLERPGVARLLPDGRMVGLAAGYVLLHVQARGEETVTLIRVSREPGRPRRGEIRLQVGEDLALPEGRRIYRILPPDLGEVRDGVLHARREGLGLLLVFRGERLAGLRRLRFGHPRQVTYVFPATDAVRFFPGEDNLFLDKLSPELRLHWGSLPEGRLTVLREGSRLWVRCDQPGRALLWVEVEGDRGTQFLARPIRCQRMPSGRREAALRLDVGEKRSFPLLRRFRVRVLGEGVRLRREGDQLVVEGTAPGVALLVVRGERGGARALPVVVGYRLQEPVRTYWLPRSDLGETLRGQIRVLGDPRVRVAQNGQIHTPPRLRVQPTVIVENEGGKVRLRLLRQIPAPAQKWHPRAPDRRRETGRPVPPR